MKLFIFCADPREEADLAEKVKQKLLAPDERAIFLSFLGGPVCLAYPENLAIDANWLLEHIRVSQQMFPELTEIVLVGHDCGYYANIPNMANASSSRKKGDIVKGTAFLESQNLGLGISAYYDSDNDAETPFEEIIGQGVLAS